MTRKTILSPCRTWRYTLWREWDRSKGYALFLGLNPSLADELVNDRTINREIAFATGLGYGALAKWNLFGVRTPYPKEMKAAADPIGPDNDRHLLRLARGAGIIVAGWGNDGSMLGRADQVLGLLARFDVHALRVTKLGQPQHPLYIKGETQPFLWRPAIV